MRMLAKIAVAMAVVGAVCPLLVLFSAPGRSEPTEAASSPWSIGSRDGLLLTAPATVRLRALSFETAMIHEEFGWASGTMPGTWDVSPLVDCRAAPTDWQSLGQLAVGELDFGIRTQDPSYPSGPLRGDTIAYVTGGTSVAWDRHSDVTTTSPEDLGVQHNYYDISGQCVTISWEDWLGGGDRDFNDCVVELCVTASPTPTPTATPTLAPVGGAVELHVDGAAPPADPSNTPSSAGSPYAALAGGLAATLLALIAGAWYARRRWLG